LDLAEQKSVIKEEGSDVTLVGSGYASLLAEKACHLLKEEGISAEVVDLRVLNPFDSSILIDSVRKTGRLLVIDSGWKSAGFSAEVISSVVENLAPELLRASPARLALPDAPAPTSKNLEAEYYLTPQKIIKFVRSMF